MEKFIFFIKQHFYALLPKQDWLGQKFIQQKKIPENHFICWHLLKTDIKSSGIDFFTLTFELTT